MSSFHFVVFYVAILFLALYLAGIAWYKKKPRWRCIILFYTLGCCDDRGICQYGSHKCDDDEPD